MLLLSLPVISQTSPWSGPLVVEFVQDSGSPNESFSIGQVWHILPNEPSNVAVRNHYAEPDLPPEIKRYNNYSYSLKTTLIESVFWQLLSANELLAAYKLMLTTKNTPLSTTPYSWIPAEATIAAIWIIKNYWHPDSPLLNPIELQSTSMLTQWGQPFSAMMTFGSRHDLQKCQPSESSRQHAPQATSHPAGYSTPPLNNKYGGDNGGPDQQLHTLDFNCFVYPCLGVCRLRLPSDSRWPAEWMMNSKESAAGQTGAIPGQSSCPHLADGNCLGCIDYSYSEDAIHPEQNSLFYTSNYLPDIQLPFDSAPLSEPLLHDISGKPDNSSNYTNEVALIGVTSESMVAGAICATKTPAPLHDDMAGNLSSGADGFAIISRSLDPNNLLEGATASVTNWFTPSLAEHCQYNLLNYRGNIRTRQEICDLTVIGQDNMPQPCGKVFTNAKYLSSHKNRIHRGQKICYLTVVGKNGKQRACGMVFRNIKALSYHKISQHTGEQTCSMTVVREDGQKRPCGKVCRSYKSLLDHERRGHSRQQTCNTTVTGEDGQPQPCGKVCKSAKALSDHKRRKHTGQKTCDFRVVREDGQLQSCGKILSNARALSDHKRRNHSEQKTCETIVIAEDGQPRPCGKVCKSALTLLEHIRGCHAKKKTCNFIVVAKDGQQRPCGKVYKSVLSLAIHKCSHGKLKFDGLEDSPNP
ncbi:MULTISPECIES: hypothetical protein [unclassified Endozoicomonas]|uniref:hypothetical protein n=1 Tax=unclassified Endozoicomonas TaxID=2644528 RepID=UPI003BAE7F3C